MLVWESNYRFCMKIGDYLYYRIAFDTYRVSKVRKIDETALLTHCECQKLQVFA